MQNCDCMYRKGVGAMIIKPKVGIFVGLRKDVNYRGAFQMPQGGVDDGEDEKDAVLRETLEEVGIKNIEIVAKSAVWHTYDYPKYVFESLQQRYPGNRYKGQAQMWFLLKFLGNDSDINIFYSGTNNEFVEWRWVLPEDLCNNIVDFKKKIYRSLVSEFNPFISKLLTNR